jgi:4-amino-4-deoxy-L-arabinose transferase-like glycosyltransferase
MTWRTLGILFLFALAVRFFTLGSAPLFDMTEGRYAEIGRLMVTTNQWAVGQLPGHVSFWGKPPLHFWLTAASFKVFGLTEFAARLPSFLGACLVLVFTFLIARPLLTRRAPRGNIALIRQEKRAGRVSQYKRKRNGSR